MLMGTYFDGNVDNVWKSVLGMCELFRSVAQFVGDIMKKREKQLGICCRFSFPLNFPLLGFVIAGERK